MFGFSLSNGATLKIKNFNASLNNILLGVEQGKPKLTVGVGISLSEADAWNIGISTNVSVIGKVVPSTNPAFNNIGRLTIESCNVNGLNINFEAGQVHFKGLILFNDNHPIYGDGFFGSIDIKIDNVMDIPGVAVGFGKKPTYKYFFVNVMVPGPIPVPGTPVIITSMVGGITYHVKPNKVSRSDYQSMTNSFAAGTLLNNPMNFTPTDTVGLGIKFGVNTRIGMEVRANAMFNMLFNNNGSVNNVNLSGNVHALVASLPVTGNMSLDYNVQSKTFDGLFGISTTYYGILSANSILKIHCSPGNWHVCFGTPSQKAGITFNLLPNNSFGGYFMTGNAIPMPNNPNIGPVRNSTVLTEGNGFCFGAEIASQVYATLPLQVLNAHISLSFLAGFDLMLLKYPSNFVCQNTGGPVGIAGRIIDGNAFINFQGSFWIDGYIKILPNCEDACIYNDYYSFEIFNKSFNLNLSLQAPKPIYFEFTEPFSKKIFDKIDISFSIPVKYGNRCNPVAN